MYSITIVNFMRTWQMQVCNPVSWACLDSERMCLDFASVAGVNYPMTVNNNLHQENSADVIVKF